MILGFTLSHFLSDPNQSPAFGLIAEEVAEVNPNLVAHNSEGQPETVQYEMVNAMLLNEFLKEHRKNEKQEARITELTAEVATLFATVKEQAAQIRKVNTFLEIGKTWIAAGGEQSIKIIGSAF